MSDQVVATGNQVTDKDIVSKLKNEYKQVEVKNLGFPTETVSLPSKGYLYPTDSPLSSGEIKMRYMTAKDEDILTSQNLIKSGKVLDELFKSLIVSPIEYDDLYLGDKNAVMIAARILGYGKDYKVEMKDPTDPEAETTIVTIDLSELKEKEVNFDIFTPGVNRCSFTLPASKIQIEFQLPTTALEKQIKEDLKGLKKNGMSSAGVDREFTTRLKRLIVSVNGDESRTGINNFVDNMLAIDSRSLREYIKEISPDVIMKFQYYSENTGETKEVGIPLDAGYFWPDING